MDALACYYAKRAPEYERIYQKPERQADLLTLRYFVAQTFRGHRVLEIACGTGWWTEVLSSTADYVLATDINEEVLTIARKKKYRNNVSFEQSDAFSLHQVTGPFNSALAAFWWSHLTASDLERFLRALHQRLEPGSVVVFIDNQFAPGSSTPLSRRDEDGNTYQQRTLADGSTTEVLKNFPSDEAITHALWNYSKELTINRCQYFWTASYLFFPPGK